MNSLVVSYFSLCSSFFHYESASVTNNTFHLPKSKTTGGQNFQFARRISGQNFNFPEESVNRISNSPEESVDRISNSPEESVDSISNLPTDIIREIQSCLPWKVAVKFRILSKEWRSIWDYHPRIILVEMDFGADYSEYSVADKAKRVAFLTYLMKFLESRKRPSEYDCDVDKLFRRMTLEDSRAKKLAKKWICFALEKTVKSLSLGLKTIYRNHYYLRGIAFCGTTLVDLTISDCEITNCLFQLPALKFLFLFVVCIEDDDFKNLIAGCPRIQKLLVLDTKKLQAIVVSNPELQFFGVYRPCSDGKIRIESANLDSLEFISFSMDLCEVEITSTTTGRELTLRKAYDQETLIHFIKKFPLLEKLIIDDCSKLQNLHLSQPNLASLVLMDCIVKDEVQINSPKLKSLEFKGRLTKFEGIEDLQELEFVQLYLDPDYKSFGRKHICSFWSYFA